jgi:hypothetical protein
MDKEQQKPPVMSATETGSRPGFLSLMVPAEAPAPSWAQLPVVRRRRLVTVLGELVVRRRAESG